jgi:hypothetical protein
MHVQKPNALIQESSLVVELKQPFAIFIRLLFGSQIGDGNSQSPNHHVPCTYEFDRYAS